MKFVVGITGSIACGKSFVSNILRKLGYPLIDTDIIAHDLTKDKTKANASLEAAFPEAVCNGILNRKKLGEIVFNDPSRRKELDNILHPLIFEITKKMIKENDGIIFVDVPLMFEAHFDILCDKIICVYTDEQTQIKRLMERDGITAEDATKRIKAQMPLQSKMEKADYLIKSENDFNDTKKNILVILDKIKEEYYA